MPQTACKRIKESQLTLLSPDGAVTVTLCIAPTLGALQIPAARSADVTRFGPPVTPSDSALATLPEKSSNS